MAFIPEQYDSGKLVRIAAATGQTIVKGDALSNADGTGYYTTVSGGDGITPTHVAMETVTTTADGQMVLAVRVSDVIFLADCSAAPAVTIRGTFLDLATKSTLDIAASLDDIFFVEEIVGTIGTSTQVRGWFTIYVPNS